MPKFSIPSALNTLLDLLLPHRCALCDAAGIQTAGLCSSCFLKIEFNQQPTCKGCARPLDDTWAGKSAPLCGDCLRSPPIFDQAVAAVRYNRAIADILLKLKHGDRLDLAPIVAKWMATAWINANAHNIDYIVPVPLHWRRQTERRYNQSLELARHLPALIGGELRPRLLLRTRNTVQMRQMTRISRQRNVAGAFKIGSLWSKKSSQLLRGKHILVVDDVYTTGATLRTIASTLRAANVSTVNILIAALVVRSK